MLELIEKIRSHLVKIVQKWHKTQIFVDWFNNSNFFEFVFGLITTISTSPDAKTGTCAVKVNPISKLMYDPSNIGPDFMNILYFSFFDLVFLRECV
jgi:hypothetical protein